jgi:uncharacterized protein
MIVGTLQFEVIVRGSESLKDKRRVVLSLKDRLHREHMVAVAEVSLQESHKAAGLGLAMVGSDETHVSQSLDRLIAKLREVVSFAGDMGAELGDVRKRIVHTQDVFAGREAAADGELDADEAATLAEEMLKRATS